MLLEICATPSCHCYQVCMVPHNMRKSTFDAWNGYHSIAFDPKDRHLTTFITHWGRYRYCVCCQGYISSGDAWRDYQWHHEQNKSHWWHCHVVPIHRRQFLPNSQVLGYVTGMESFLTCQSCSLLKKQSILQVLKLRQQLFVYVHKSWEQFRNFSHPA